MSDIKLFRIGSDTVKEEQSQSATVEKSLSSWSNAISTHSSASDFSTPSTAPGKTHGCRIRRSRIDAGRFAARYQVQRATDENVISQGLDYRCLSAKAEFQLLVQKRLGQEAADNIEWSTPRLICIAGDFTEGHQYAVQQINRNIQLPDTGGLPTTSWYWNSSIGGRVRNRQLVRRQMRSAARRRQRRTLPSRIRN